jgi:hypothetical protein
VPAVRNNPNPEPYPLDQVGFLAALHKVFGGYDDELNKVRFLIANRGQRRRPDHLDRAGRRRAAHVEADADPPAVKTPRWPSAIRTT